MRSPLHPAFTADESASERLAHATVLVELGELEEAELIISEVRREHPDDLDALSLLAKVKHMQGRLTEALRAWAELHARAPHQERALLVLQSCLHLARDPERHGGPFYPLLGDRLGRKPPIHVELEQAFTRLLARRPDEARARCAAIAGQHRHGDQESYKLAVLARAYIDELTGDLERAATTLEALGRERGFEVDTDRILALARVLERLGGPERLVQASNICRYLERTFGKLSAVGRLAGIYRKLGREDLAREYDARFLASFQQRMHRPSPAQVLQVAARHYVTLPRLRALGLPEPAALHTLDGREQALAHALAHRVDAAREALKRDGGPTARLYAADLDAEAGRVEDAARVYVERLRAAPDDLRVMEQLLSLPRLPISAAFFTSEAGRRARAHLESGVQMAPTRVRGWQALAAVHTLLGPSADAPRLHARVEAMEGAASRDALPVGRALAAAVYHFVGRAKGLVHELQAERRPVGSGRGGSLDVADVHGNLTPESVQVIRTIFLSVRDYARSRFPHLTQDLFDFAYTFKITKEDEPSGGLSLGLPTALAFLSVFLQRPLPQSLAASGMIVTDAHDVIIIRRIGEAEFKVKAAANRNLQTLLLPDENRMDLQDCPEVPRAVVEALVRYAANLDDAVTLAFGASIWTA